MNFSAGALLNITPIDVAREEVAGIEGGPRATRDALGRGGTRQGNGELAVVGPGHQARPRSKRLTRRWPRLRLLWWQIES